MAELKHIGGLEEELVGKRYSLQGESRFKVLGGVHKWEELHLSVS